MKRLGLILLLVLTLGASAPSAQDKASRVQTIIVGHTVLLAWNASPSPGVTGYKIYSSAVSGSGYTFTGNTATTTYTDLKTIAGHTYYYVVTAVTSSGESAYSNEAKAVVPTP